MTKHQHNPIEFYSDAHEDPVFVKCADCNEPLNVSSAMLESLYGDEERQAVHPTWTDGGDGTVALD